MPIKINGSKYLLWIGGAIAICVSVTIFLDQRHTATCPLPEVKETLEQRIDLHYQVIKEDISEIKEDIKVINSKLK